MSANREYKDSVFTLLFGTPEKMIELYNAVSGSNLPSDTPITDATLKDALFMDRINDLAFVIEGKLVVLIEHQSTVCQNMPLRLLLYIARVYERLVDKRSAYKSKLIKLPRPEFYVLYNGIATMPDKTALRLSGAFMDCPEGAAKYGGFCPLELEVPVINVNAGRNHDIIGRSENLSGYVCFVDKAREYRASGLDMKEALEAAIEYCIGNGILDDFLDKNSREVRGMLFTEFKMDDALDVRFEEGWEEGREEGREEGIAIGEVRGEARSVKRMIGRGLSLEAIADAMGYSLDEVAAMSRM